jgi:phenylpropionate dioxygenase-like ring-hydroxylating dioxygenase large terminal subunit
MINTAVDPKKLEEVKEKIAQGRMPQWILNNPAIYDLEMEKIFAHAWQFLAHESELPEPGCYVTRWIVHDPILVVRTKQGQIKAFLNSCPHRGAQLCTADFGKKNTFQCPYHGWSFNNEGSLIGMVAGDKVYDGQVMDKKEWGLREIPQVAIYEGMIFGCLSHDTMPLEQYLGDLKWYLDIMMKRSDGGMEVRGVPQRWVLNVNWKLSSENFGGDPYHVATSHRSTVELGISPQDPLYSGYGSQVVLNNGHTVNVNMGVPGLKKPPFQGLPQEMWPMFEKNLTKEQYRIFENCTVIVGTCFPNLSFLSPMHGAEGHLHNYVNMRVWRPIAEDQIEVWSWFFIDKAAPEEYKEQAYKGYIASFGPSGNLEQDDAEIWTRVTNASKGIMARDKDLKYNNELNYMMGIGKMEPLQDWAGPGVAYPTCYVDFGFQNQYRFWLQLLMGEANLQAPAQAAQK